VEAGSAPGARLDDADNRGGSAPMIAAERGHAAIAKLLLARGAADIIAIS